MLDIRFIRDNADAVQAAADHKGYEVSIAQLLQVDDQRRQLQQQVDALRQRRNTLSAQLKGGQPDTQLIDQGKQLKTELAGHEDRLRSVEAQYNQLLQAVPNITLPDVPLGGEADSVEVKGWGEQTSGALVHLDFALRRDWVVCERGAKVAGAKFY